MGVDFYIRPEQEVRGDGVDPWFHLNWAMMDLVEELLDQAGVLDNDTQGPVLPPDADKLDTDTYERVYDAAHKRWEGEQLVWATSLDAIKVPVVKFHTNEGWILTSRECQMLAGALRGVSVEDVRVVFEADEGTCSRGRCGATLPPKLLSSCGRSWATALHSTST